MEHYTGRRSGRALQRVSAGEGVHIDRCVGLRYMCNHAPYHFTSLRRIVHADDHVFPTVGRRRGRSTMACMSLISSTGTAVVSARATLFSS